MREAPPVRRAGLFHFRYMDDVGREVRPNEALSAKALGAFVKLPQLSKCAG